MDIKEKAIYKRELLRKQQLENAKKAEIVYLADKGVENGKSENKSSKTSGSKFGKQSKSKQDSKSEA